MDATMQAFIATLKAEGYILPAGTKHESEQFKTCGKHVCSSTIPGFEAADVMESQCP